MSADKHDPRREESTMKRTLSKLSTLIYPPTKAKLHRALHALLTLVAVGASVAVWIQGQHWGWSVGNQIEAQAALAGTLFARATAVFKRLDAAVDSLPIPAGNDVAEPPKPSAGG
jgi:hypothetical protein